jgi:hypothetical protein
MFLEDLPQILYARERDPDSFTEELLDSWRENIRRTFRV